MFLLFAGPAGVFLLSDPSTLRCRECRGVATKTRLECSHKEVKPQFISDRCTWATARWQGAWLPRGHGCYGRMVVKGVRLLRGRTWATTRCQGRTWCPRRSTCKIKWGLKLLHYRIWRALVGAVGTRHLRCFGRGRWDPAPKVLWSGPLGPGT